MTETLPAVSPSTSAPPDDAAAGPPAGRPSPVVAGALAALAAGAVGLLLVVVVVLVGWAGGGTRGVPALDAGRAAARVWLLAHGTALDAPTGRFSLTPLGLAAGPLALLWHAGRSVARDLGAGSVRGAARAALSVVAPYAALTGAVALATGTHALSPSPVTAVLGGAVVALLGAGAGALGASGLRLSVWPAPGRRPRRTVLASAAALGVLLGGGALLVGGSLALHGGRAAELFAATAPGAVGGAALLLIGLAYLPTAAVWAACWLAGPGFAVGAGTAVGPFGHELGAVPALPLLAALPSGGVPGWAGALALLVPLSAGALAGGVLHRLRDGVSRGGQALDVVLTAAACGSAVAVLAWLSGGAVSGERLAHVGPAAGSCGAAVALEVLAGALAAVAVLRRRRA